MIPTTNKRSASRTGGRIGRVGMPNPAATYAVQQGLPYAIREDAQGNQYGVVTLPSGQEIEEWAYYRKNYPPTPTVPEHSTGLILPHPSPMKKKKLLPNNPIIRRISNSINQTSSYVLKKKKTSVSPQSKPNKSENIINIKKLMGEEKRSLFFS